MELEKQPSPGSEEAVGQGCTCAVLDNRYGQGIPYPDLDNPGKFVACFWINMSCPLHGAGSREGGSDAES